jgi:hypothetical protein
MGATQFTNKRFPTALQMNQIFSACACVSVIAFCPKGAVQRSPVQQPPFKDVCANGWVFGDRKRRSQMRGCKLRGPALS